MGAPSTVLESLLVQRSASARLLAWAVAWVLAGSNLAAATQPLIRINCGGPTYTDSSGLSWSADKYFSGGSTKTYSSNHTITGTADSLVYLSERFGKTLAYSVPVANGTYTVTLYFAELYFTAAGKRIFDVTLEGNPFLHNFDIYATAGMNAAVERSAPVTVSDGILKIVASASVNSGKFSAIQIAPATPSPTPTPSATPVPSPPSGPRIAISSDGNWHDRDDICSTAVTIALLAKTGNQARLVHYDYADHFWITDATREEEMRISAIETAKLWGGFDLGVFYNSTRLTSLAVSHLSAEINKSSASNPLTILGCGPMQTIGLAVAQADPAKRQYVTLVSHSLWNDVHAADYGPSEGLIGTAYSYKSIGALGVKLLHIVDQNFALSKPYSDYNWLQISSDPKLRWLWDRGQAAGKNNYDCSDAGETYFELTGDQYATVAKLQSLLTAP